MPASQPRDQAPRYLCLIPALELEYGWVATAAETVHSNMMKCADN